MSFKIFLIYSSSGYFVRRSETFCAILVEIILNLDPWLRRRRRLKIVFIYSSASQFVRRTGTICAVLGEGIIRNFSL